jgi:hypothetical protein
MLGTVLMLAFVALGFVLHEGRGPIALIDERWRLRGRSIMVFESPENGTFNLVNCYAQKWSDAFYIVP